MARVELSAAEVNVGLCETESLPDLRTCSACAICCSAALGVAGVTGGGSGGVLGSSRGVLGYWYAKSLAMIGIGGGILPRCLTLSGREGVLARSLEACTLAIVLFGL
jgi:hypothetical protein